jgi:beta-mannosidase
MTVANHDGASKRWRARARVAARAVGRSRLMGPVATNTLLAVNATTTANEVEALHSEDARRAGAGLGLTLSSPDKTLHPLSEDVSLATGSDLADGGLQAAAAQASAGENPRDTQALSAIAIAIGTSSEAANDPMRAPTGERMPSRTLDSDAPLSMPALLAHARPLDITVPLDHGWQLLGTPAGAYATPEALRADDDWIRAPVPGTVAQALRDAGRWNGDAPQADADLDGRDWWYSCRFTGTGSHMLRCDGLATLAEVWVDGVLHLQARNMFATHEVELDLGELPAREHTLHLVFRALTATPLRRQRWRQKLISAPALRGLRSTALGRMPGWCAPVPAVGPWRQLALVDLQQQWISHVDIETRVVDGVGIVNLRVEVRPSRLTRQACVGGKRADGEAFVSMICGDQQNAMRRVDSNVFEGELSMPAVRLWWPHTHGESTLHDLSVEIGGGRFDLGRVGFRTIEVEHGEDGAGFSLIVNGVRVFCRGACWTAADLVALPSTREAYEPWLRAARDANMNMVRIAGVMTYEANPFFELCDELGILVWQDMMFANFDYPADDPLFSADVSAEVEQLLLRTQANPSLAVICGGSEVAQQAAMFGVEARAALPDFFTERLPALVARYRPDLVYVPNSPSGGALPFQPDTSIAHYYGVGAYRRGFDDVRRSNVRFASECLALSNVPAEETLAVLMPGVAAGTDAWKTGVPRDNGADWDFEDVRDHYLQTLYGLDPTATRAADPRLYLDASRAVSADLITEVFSEWRRHGSSCAGGLVWQLQDLRAGAGWGVIGVDGRPKAAWYAMKSVFKPVQLLITDEGLNGLHLHIVNDRPTPLMARVELSSLRHGEVSLVNGTTEIEVAPHSTVRLSAAAIVGRFFDFTYAYRFGPREHDVTLASLYDAATGQLIGEASHLPDRTLGAPVELGLQATLERAAVDGSWTLVLEARRFARFVQIVDPHYTADDNFFHLAPGRTKRVRLQARDSHAGTPAGQVRALNGVQGLEYRGL